MFHNFLSYCFVDFLQKCNNRVWFLDVGFLIGVPVRKELRTDAAIDDAINSAYALDNCTYYFSI